MDAEISVIVPPALGRPLTLEVFGLRMEASGVMPDSLFVICKRPPVFLSVLLA